MEGLYYELRLQLARNTYPTFQALVNRAIVLDNMRKGQDKKRRMLAQGSGSKNRQRFSSQQGYQQRYQGPVSQWNPQPATSAFPKSITKWESASSIPVA